jgi:hypothetical protein
MGIERLENIQLAFWQAIRYYILMVRNPEAPQKEVEKTNELKLLVADYAIAHEQV